MPPPMYGGTSEQTPLLNQKSNRPAYSHTAVAVGSLLLGLCGGLLVSLGSNSYEGPAALGEHVRVHSRTTDTDTNHFQTSISEHASTTFGSLSSTQSYEFYQCVNESASISIPSTYTYDGTADVTFDKLEHSALPFPIATVMRDGDTMKVYDVAYKLPDLDNFQDLEQLGQQVEDYKKTVSGTCKNPLVDAVNSDLLANTSKACESRLLEEAKEVFNAFHKCEKTYVDLDNVWKSYTTWTADDSISYNDLPEQRTALDTLFETRRSAGQAYDTAYDEWKASYNEALGSCEYAAHYNSYWNKVKDEFSDKISAKKDEVRKLCDNMPADQPFAIDQAHTVDKASRHLLTSSDQSTTYFPACNSVLEAISGLSTSTDSTWSSRATCLGYFCSLNGDAAAAADPTAKYSEWVKADDAFIAAYDAYLLNHDAYVQHLGAIMSNNNSVTLGFSSVDNLQSIIDNTYKLFDTTVKCPASSICCESPQHIPQICAEDAAGKVAHFDTPVEFYLKFPPPPSPPPSPPSPPPPPPPPSPPPRTITSAVNSYDAAFNEHHQNYFVYSIWSKHHNGAEDRKFKLKFAHFKQVFPSATEQTLTEYKTNYLNNWDADVNWDESNRFMTGMYSKHDNGREDRRYKVYYSNLPNGYSLQSCSWTSYTGWDAEWTHSKTSLTQVIAGMKSYHDNGREDRKFKFKWCTPVKM